MQEYDKVIENDGVAQLVEHGTHKPGVVGSIPTSVTYKPVSGHKPQTVVRLHSSAQKLL